MAEDQDEDDEAYGGDKRDGGDVDDDLFGWSHYGAQSGKILLGKTVASRIYLKEYLLAVCGRKDTKKKLGSLLYEKASTVCLLVVIFPYEMKWCLRCMILYCASQRRDGGGAGCCSPACSTPSPPTTTPSGCCSRPTSDSKPCDLTGFVDLFLEQTTVVKMAEDKEEDGESNGGDKRGGDGDDDDLFGLVRVLILERHRENHCIKDLKEHLLAICDTRTPRRSASHCWKRKCLLLAFWCAIAFVNFPYEMVPKMYAIVPSNVG